MKTAQPAKRRMLWIALAASLIATLAIWLSMPNEAAAHAKELADAEQRWNNRSFGHYQLNLKDKNCVQDIEIRNERVLAAAPNRCEIPPRTINDLFDLIRRNGQISQPCIYQGCACDDVLWVNATYDSELGFPTRIIVRVQAVPNWRHLDYWKRAFTRGKLPSCSGMAEGSKIIQVLALNPIR
jgi:hypothetical protein